MFSIYRSKEHYFAYDYYSPVNKVGANVYKCLNRAWDVGGVVVVEAWGA